MIGWIIKGGYSYGLKRSAPGVSDMDYPVGYIWVDTVATVAYVLSSVEEGQATWVVKSPDTIINNGTGGQINVIGETSTGDLISMTPGIVQPAGIISNPGVGEHKITNLRVDQNHKLVATYEE